MSTPIEASKADLAEQIAKARGPEDGTVIRFDQTVPASFEADTPERTFTYAALFVAGHWYLTGTAHATSLSRQRYGNAAFIDLMAKPDITNVEIATAFEVVA